MSVVNMLPQGGTIKKLLWTNPSPSASFGAQTVTLSESMYNFKRIRIVYKRTDVDSIDENLFSEWDIENGGASYLVSGDENSRIVIAMRGLSYSYCRLAYISSSTKIAFEACYRLNNSGGNGNLYCLPCKIYGIK